MRVLMRPELRQCLIEHDFFRILQMPVDETWSPVELFVYFDALNLTKDLQGAREFYRDHLSSLKELGLDQLALGRLKGEMGLNFGAEFVAMVTLKEKLPEDSYVLGRFFFYLGFLCSQEQLFDYTPYFFEKAVEHFHDGGFLAWQLMSLHNISIATLFHGQLERKRQVDAEIEALRTQLPSVARSFVSFHRAIIPLYLKKYPEAMAEFQTSLEVSSLHGLRSQTSNTLVYIAYVLLKSRRCDEFFALRPRLVEVGAIERDLRVFDEMNILVSTENLSFQESSERLQSWVGWEEPLRLLMLVDVLFSRFLEARRFDELKALLQLARTQVIRRKAVLPVSDLGFYEAVVEAQTTSRGVLFDRYQQKLARLQAPWLVDELQATLKLSARPVQLTLNLESGLLTEGSREISLAGKKKVMRLLEVLISCKRPMSFEELFRALHGVELRDVSQRKSLETLIYRTRQLVGREWLPVQGGRVRLVGAESSRLVRARKVRKTVWQRRQSLLEFLRTSREPLPLRALQEAMSLNRRTLQEDLLHLVKAGQVLRMGRGKGTVYSINGSAL